MPIPETVLARTGLVTTRLGFGTSRLHHIRDRERQNVLSTVADIGIRHLDTAPSYGDGLAERELGSFLAGRRGRFVVVTKYGLPLDPLLNAIPSLGAPLRAARMMARRAGLWQQGRPPLEGESLIRSVEGSLRRLRCEWIDVLLLHEPSLERLVDPSEMQCAMEALITRGLIRHFGVAGSWTNIASVLSSVPALGQVVQTGETEWVEGHPPDITYGAIHARVQTYASSEKVGNPEATERLIQALRRRKEGVVLVSTTKSEHLKSVSSVLHRNFADDS